MPAADAASDATIVGMGLGAEDDTIVAVATAPGRGGVGIVRLSGARALEIARAILTPAGRGSIAPAGAETGQREPAATGAFASQSPPASAGSGQADGWRPWRVRRMLFSDLEEVLVTYFAAPHSYTAEDVIEIAAHGSPPVLAALVAAAQARGARLAEPGEFTRRAFLHGKMDLTQAEAVRDLIAAETLLQARTAARQLRGAAAAGLAPLRRQVLELVARLEAGIDFADDDVSVMSGEALAASLHELRQAAAAALEQFQRGRYAREGVSLAILGRPNVGKSSLFNRLFGAERVIVTATPGTTRDLVSEGIDLEGIPARLVDTAGIRHASDEAERLGIAKSRQAGADADLVLAVFDAARAWESADAELLRELGSYPRVVVIWNKCDLPRRASGAQLREALEAAGIGGGVEGIHEVSALTGAGVPELRRRLRQMLAPDAEAAAGWLGNARHAARLQDFVAALERAQAGLRQNMPHEALLVDLHQARRELEAITGMSDIEDILGIIFSTFCVGK